MLRDSSPFPKSNTENPLGRVAPWAPGSRAFGLRACVCVGGPAGDVLSGWRDGESRSLACGPHCHLPTQWGLSVCRSVVVSTPALLPWGHREDSTPESSRPNSSVLGPHAPCRRWGLCMLWGGRRGLYSRDAQPAAPSSRAPSPSPDFVSALLSAGNLSA